MFRFALGLQRPINASNAVTVAHQVRTYTLEAAGFTDSVDVLYVAQMMERFMEYVKPLQEVRGFFNFTENNMKVDSFSKWGLGSQIRFCTELIYMNHLNREHWVRCAEHS